jgi:hypothetical protein
MELMTALVFGDENSESEAEQHQSRYDKTEMRVPIVNRDNPRAVNPMPMEATTLGSILSETLPARGEKTAITTGWEIRIIPACSGVKPLLMDETIK